MGNSQSALPTDAPTARASADTSSRHRSSHHHGYPGSSLDASRRAALSSRSTGSLRDADATARRAARRAARQAAEQAQQQREPIDTSEIVDGGHVAPVNALYHATHHYDPYLVRDLIRVRRLAPFYAGLEDVDEDEIAAMAAASLVAGPAAPASAAGSGADTEDVARVKAWMARVGGAIECPICFLFTAQNINRSKCCDQPICTECFVQIKRPDATNPADCPYCAMPGFAVYYTPPNPTPLPAVLSAPAATEPIAVPTSSSSSHLAAPEPWPSTTSAHSLGATDLSVSPRATLTVTATTYTRTTRSASTSALPTATSSTANDTDSDSNAARPSTDTAVSTSASPGDPITSDAIRPEYVRQLKQQHQLDTLREHQEAAAGRIRRLLVEQQQAGAIPAAAATAALLAMTLGAGGGGGGNSRARSSRSGRSDRSPAASAVPAAPAFGVDLEELMVMEAIRQSLAEEEARTLRQQREQQQQGQQQTGSASGENASGPVPRRDTDEEVALPASSASAEPSSSSPNEEAAPADAVSPIVDPADAAAPPEPVVAGLGEKPAPPSAASLHEAEGVGASSSAAAS
ncbi:SNF1-interacting protein [Allomyces arbusculus]|nr:SNF1-interacting protein [Allomyces arbusculus]